MAHVRNSERATCNFPTNIRISYQHIHEMNVACRYHFTSIPNCGISVPCSVDNKNDVRPLSVKISSRPINATDWKPFRHFSPSRNRRERPSLSLTPWHSHGKMSLSAVDVTSTGRHRSLFVNRLHIVLILNEKPVSQSAQQLRAQADFRGRTTRKIQKCIDFV